MLSLIQAYRGIAALLVVLYHASVTTSAYFGDSPLLHLFHFGWAGVQFFFVLSGFIIYHVHRSDIDTPARVSPYVRKRIVRIYPVYIFATLFLAPFWLCVPGLGEPYHKDLTALLLSLLLIPQDHPPHLAVAWTLIHEMIFYAMFATLLLSRAVGRVVLSLWFCAISLASISGSDLPLPINYLLSLNNLLFGLGMLAAMWRQEFGWTSFAIGNGLFLAAGSFANAGYSGSLLIFAFGFASFLILLSAKRLDAPFRRRWLRLLGDASYSIYLSHYPAISLIAKAMSIAGVQSQLTAFAASALFAVAAGFALHLLVEKPLQEIIKKGYPWP